MSNKIYVLLKYISPLINNSPNSNNSILESELLDEPTYLSSNTVDNSSSESSDNDIDSLSVEHSYIETPELQEIIEEQIDYIYPCKCKNPIHIKCFINWLSYKNTTTCEICNSQYSIDLNVCNSYLNNINNNNNNNNSNRIPIVDSNNINNNNSNYIILI